MSMRAWYILKDSTKLLSFDVDALGNREVTWVNECVMWVILTSDVSNDAVTEAKKKHIARHRVATLLATKKDTKPPCKTQRMLNKEYSQES